MGVWGIGVILSFKTVNSPLAVLSRFFRCPRGSGSEAGEKLALDFSAPHDAEG